MFKTKIQEIFADIKLVKSELINKAAVIHYDLQTTIGTLRAKNFKLKSSVEELNQYFRRDNFIVSDILSSSAESAGAVDESFSMIKPSKQTAEKVIEFCNVVLGVPAAQDIFQQLIMLSPKELVCLGL